MFRNNDDEYSPGTSSSRRKKRRYADDPEKHKQPSLYELSYMDGLKRSNNDDDYFEESEHRRGRASNKDRTPLKYQLQEVDEDQMMLQPLPTSKGGPPLSSRNKITPSNKEAAQNMASSFAYMSQQVTKSNTKANKATKSSGSKHLEL